MAGDKAKALKKMLKKVQKRHKKMSVKRKRLYTNHEYAKLDKLDKELLNIRKQEEDLKKQIKAMSSLQSLRF